MSTLIGDGTQGIDVSRGMIPVFDGKQFSLWKMQMTSYLEFKELLDVVENPVVGLQTSSLGTTSVTVGNGSGNDNEEQKTPVLTNAQKEKIKKSRQAYNILLMALKNEQLQMVVDIPRGNAHGVWSALLSRYERKTVASKISLRNELHNIEIKHGEHIDMYISRVKQLVLSLADMGSRMSNDELIYVLFKGLPAAYQATIDTLSLKDKLEFEEACTYLRDRYERLVITENKDEKNDSVSLVTEKQRYKKKKEFMEKDKLKGKSKSEFKCSTCNKPGHIQYYCPQNKDKKKCSYCRKLGHERAECYFSNGEQEEKEEEQETCDYIF